MSAIGANLGLSGDALACGRPYAFVGFAFGAILAWEVGQAVARRSAARLPTASR